VCSPESGASNTSERPSVGCVNTSLKTRRPSVLKTSNSNPPDRRDQYRGAGARHPAGYPATRISHPKAIARAGAILTEGRSGGRADLKAGPVRGFERVWRPAQHWGTMTSTATSLIRLTICAACSPICTWAYPSFSKTGLSDSTRTVVPGLAVPGITLMTPADTSADVPSTRWSSCDVLQPIKAIVTLPQANSKAV